MNRRTLLQSLPAAALLPTAALADAPPSTSTVYELRVYHAVPGRLPDLLKRFDTITLNIWRRHGIEQAGFWTVAIGDSNQTLYYFLKWDSLADREKKWAAFQADPEWIAKRAETEKDGQIVLTIVNQLLAPTAFSSVK